MAVHYRTQGFILSKDDLREADQAFSIYTKDFGKLQVLGRAIRKIKSKLRSGTELFYLSEIEFIQGRNYKTLTDAILIEKFKNVRSDLEKLATAYEITELADSLIQGQEKDERIWQLLEEVFKILNNSKLKNIYYYFLWNLLAVLGYQIDLYNCVLCQNKLVPQNLYFSLKEGGIACSGCSGKVETLEQISPEVIKILRLFIQKDWKTISRLRMSEFYKNELESISESYLFYLKESTNML